MKTIIIDTCVLLDIFIIKRPRHEKAVALYDLILKNNIELQAPYTAVLELSSGIKSEKKTQSVKFTNKIPWTKPMKVRFVPIDENFFNKYFNINIPYIPAYDSLLLLMAKKDAFPLLTEDKKHVRKRAESIGLEVYNIEELTLKLKTG